MRHAILPWCVPTLHGIGNGGPVLGPRVGGDQLGQLRVLGLAPRPVVDGDVELAVHQGKAPGMRRHRRLLEERMGMQIEDRVRERLAWNATSVATEHVTGQASVVY